MKRVILSAMILILALSACSQEEPKTLKELLKESIEKRIEKNAVEMTIVNKSDKDITEQKVWAEKGEANGAKIFKVVIEDDKHSEYFDGKTLIYLLHQEKKYYKMTDVRSLSRALKHYTELLEPVLEIAAKEDAFKEIDTNKAFDEKYKITDQDKEMYIIESNFEYEEYGFNEKTIRKVLKNDGVISSTKTKVYKGDHIISLDEIDVKSYNYKDDIDDAKFTTVIPEDYTDKEIEDKAKQEAETTEVEKPIDLKVGDIAPDFTLKDGNGNDVSLSQFKGKPVLLDFWGTWCFWCVVAMPEIDQINTEITKEGGIVYGISCREPKGADPVAFMKEKKVSYPTMLEGLEVAKKYGVTGYPTLFIVGKDGTIIHKQVGFDKGIEKQLLDIMKKDLAK